VRTGHAAFDRAHGQTFFAYLLEHPDAADNFNAAMTGFAEATRTAVADSYDFSIFDTLVDVGGGHGALLAKVLESTPGLRGMLFDLPAVVEGARRELDARGLGDRCDFVAGDFFTAVPAGAEGYLLTGILHDWDDPRSLAILRSCRRAIRPDGRLLIGEQVIPDDPEPFFGKLLDLEMLVLIGGRERTETEYRALLERAGFALQRVIPTAAATSILEAIPLRPAT
jgi:hypothetical protein